MQPNFEKWAFYALNAIFILLCIALLYDAIRGDNNGVVAGIPVSNATKMIGIGTFFYSFWYAFKAKIDWLQQAFVSLITLVLTLVALEGFFGILLKNKPKTNLSEGPIYHTVSDEVLGYKGAVNQPFQEKKTWNKKPVYEVIYHTDSNSLRVTPPHPSAEYMPKISKYGQFFGCSFTWGEGLDSTQTTSYYFQKSNPTFKAYNFGYSGYGPHQMLARFESNQVKNIVKEKDGFAIYVYIDDHAKRATGSTASFNNNGGRTPYYAEEHGKIVRHGFFNTGRIIPNFIYRTIRESNLCRYFDIGYPVKISVIEYNRTASIIAEAAKNYQNQFGNTYFYVLIFPSLEDNTQIVKILQDKKVNVLDYSQLYDASKPEYMIAHDGHPSALANRLVIEQLNKNLAGLLSK